MGVGVGTKICPLALQNPSFSAITSDSIHNTFTHLFHHNVIYSLHTFSKQQYHLTLLAQSSIFLQPFSSPYNSFHLLCTNRFLSHVTNKCSTSSPSPLSHITHLSSIIISHLFLSSNNPAELVFSLNSSLTTSWSCTEIEYLSTLHHCCELIPLHSTLVAYFLHAVLLISQFVFPSSYILITSSSKSHTFPTSWILLRILVYLLHF